MKRILTTMIVFALLIGGCTGADQLPINAADISGTMDVGTIVQNPKPPSEVILQIFPDFQTNLPGLSQMSNTDIEHIIVPDSTERMNTILMLGKIFNADNIRNFDVSALFLAIDSLGTILKKTLADNSIALPVTTSTSVTLSENARLLSLDQYQWIVRLEPEVDYPDYTRMYFIHPESHQILASYVFKNDSTGKVEKGMLGVAFPESLSSQNEHRGKIRVSVLSFDFSDQAQNLFNISMDRKQNPQLSQSGQLFVQCNLTTSSCVGEQQSIISEPPTRTFANPMPRYQWQSNNLDVCFGEMKYQADTAALNNVLLYEGNTHTVTKEACTIATPIWGTHVFTPDDLFIRIEDTVSESTFNAIFGDGQSYDSWQQFISPALIEQTLDGSNQKI
ncbi:MAG: hypothetical protein ACD_62C00035G0007 [uncultured bacterium]|nr:MAG: hypothetical protein ACD_62C00035G0007 [uncultured bacterium]HLD45315.1 hypothetical protein [bacterium]